MNYYVYLKNGKLTYSNNEPGYQDVLNSSDNLETFKLSLIFTIRIHYQSIRSRLDDIKRYNEVLESLTKILTNYDYYLRKEINHLTCFEKYKKYFSVKRVGTELVYDSYTCVNFDKFGNGFFIKTNDDAISAPVRLNTNSLFKTRGDALIYYIKYINLNKNTYERTVYQLQKKVITAIKERNFYIKLLNKLNN